jgi:hypothetical protein
MADMIHGVPIGPIRFLIPPGVATEAVARGRHHRSQETDPFIRRQLDDLLFHASNPSSPRAGSAIDTLLWLGRATSEAATYRRKSLR